MSSPPETPEPSLQFKLILDAALRGYNQKTGNDLLDNQLAEKVQGCESVAYFGIPTVAKILLENGADVNARNDQGETPLHLMSRGKYSPL
ncbi:hypothetical protein EDB87DRAFT_1622320 [Lactarius vividus]|nr:hypothetical protein EDB87DRAFT_1622320 [Lactarius vividus]